jgi:hypothetical protein
VSERDQKPANNPSGPSEAAGAKLPGSESHGSRFHVRHVSMPHVGVPHVAAPKITPPSITPPNISRPSNQDVSTAAARGSRLVAVGWWLARTGAVRHRVTMFRLYSSTMRTPKRPK